MRVVWEDRALRTAIVQAAVAVFYYLFANTGYLVLLIIFHTFADSVPSHPSLICLTHLE
jgi:hypothetical protein